MPGHRISLDVVARFVDVAVDALAAAREEIDALNVYPVPDGDTGTNMFLTVSAARDALREATGGRTRAPRRRSPPSPRARSSARGATPGSSSARCWAPIAHRIAAADPDERNAAVMAAALEAATDAAYDAVGTPVEGTMLTVAGPPPTPLSRRPRRPAPGPARCSPGGPRLPARRWRARPTSSRSWPTRVSSTPAAVA